MWVRFTKDFDYAVPGKGGRVTIAYKAGTVKNVTRACADLAIAAERAQLRDKDHDNEDPRPAQA